MNKTSQPRLVSKSSKEVTAYNATNAEAIEAGLVPAWAQDELSKKSEAEQKVRDQKVAQERAVAKSYEDKLDNIVKKWNKEHGTDLSFSFDDAYAKRDIWSRSERIVGKVFWCGGHKIATYRFDDAKQLNWVRIEGQVQQRCFEKRIEIQRAHDAAMRKAAGEIGLSEVKADLVSYHGAVEMEVNATDSTRFTVFTSEWCPHAGPRGKGGYARRTIYSNNTLDTIKALIKARKEYNKLVKDILAADQPGDKK